MRTRLLLSILGLLVLAGVVATPTFAALPDSILQVEGTHIVVADSAGDYAGDLGSATDQISLASLAASGARQSDKIDFGTNRASIWGMYSAIEFDVAPTSGNLVDHYLCFSPSGTAGTANPGGSSGSDAAYTGTAGDSLDDSIKQCTLIGSLVATADAATTVEFQTIGLFTAPTQYANLVVDNNADQALEGDDVEMGVLIIPLESRIID